MNKYTIGTFVLVVVLLFFVKKSFFTTKDEVRLPAAASQTSHKPQKPQPLPAEAPDPVKPPQLGWKPTEGELGYSWVTPIDLNTSTTPNLEIRDWTTTYRILNTCVQQFVKADGTVIAAFKADVDNRANYLETPTGSGNFASEPWSKSEHTKAWKKAESVSFRPLNNEPLDLKVGRMR